MKRTALIGFLLTGCFDPGASEAADSSAEAETDAAPPQDDDDDDGGMVTGIDTDDDGGESGETGESGESGETGETGETDDGSSSTDTGEVCEEPLGTEENCLDCGDACAAGDLCTPDGCATPTAVGFDEPFTGTGGYPNRLWGFPVDLQAGWVTELDFHATGTGGDIQLALYTEGGDYVVASDVLEDYGPGTHVLPVESTWVEAGTYLLMARNSPPSHVGQNFDPDVLPYFELTAIDLAFEAELPEQLGTTLTFPSYEMNLWLTLAF